MNLYRVSHQDWNSMIWHNSAWEAAILALVSTTFPRVKVERMTFPEAGFAGWVWISGQSPLHYKRRPEGGVILLNDSGAYEAGSIFRGEGIQLYSQIEIGSWVG